MVGLGISQRQERHIWARVLSGPLNMGAEPQPPQPCRCRLRQPMDKVLLSFPGLQPRWPLESATGSLDPHTELSFCPPRVMGDRKPGGAYNSCIRRVGAQVCPRPTAWTRILTSVLTPGSGFSVLPLVFPCPIRFDPPHCCHRAQPSGPLHSSFSGLTT